MLPYELAGGADLEPLARRDVARHASHGSTTDVPVICALTTALSPMVERVLRRDLALDVALDTHRALEQRACRRRGCPCRGTRWCCPRRSPSWASSRSLIPSTSRGAGAGRHLGRRASAGSATARSLRSRSFPNIAIECTPRVLGPSTPRRARGHPEAASASSTARARSVKSCGRTALRPCAGDRPGDPARHPSRTRSRSRRRGPAALHAHARAEPARQLVRERPPVQVRRPPAGRRASGRVRRACARRSASLFGSSSAAISRANATCASHRPRRTSTARACAAR